jgi:hypothetical protein
VLGFVALILAVLGLIHLYLWKRLVRDPMRTGWPRRLGGLAALLLAVLVPATLIGTRTGHGKWLAWPGFLWLAMMFYLFVILAVLEVPRLVVALVMRRKGPAEPAPDTSGTDHERPPAPAPDTSGTDHERPAAPAPDTSGIDRRLLLARSAAIFAGLTAAGITAYGARTALGPPRLLRVQIPLAKLSRALDGTRLAVVADIHLGPLTGSHQAGRIVDLINSVNADIVCVVGDLVDGTVAELGRFAEPLANIRARHGAYFVTGNHEYYSGFQPWVDEVARLGRRPCATSESRSAGWTWPGSTTSPARASATPPISAKRPAAATPRAQSC